MQQQCPLSKATFFVINRIQRSIDFKDSFSMVADGSDNQEYGFPYFSLNDKDTSCGQKFKVIHCVLDGAL
jgi:hypothetical protein